MMYSVRNYSSHIKKEVHIKQDLTVPVITIDGGAQVGKGTASKGVAKRFGFHRLDSGILYRAVGVLAHDASQLHNESVIIGIAQNLQIAFEDDCVLIDGRDYTHEIRTENASTYASYVSKIQEVRDALLAVQLGMRTAPGLVADGRDQGVIFDTPFRFFLTADPEEKARRRKRDLQKAGINLSYKEVLKRILDRDAADTNREISQLKPHPNAIIIDTTPMLPTQVVDLICHHCTF